MLKKIFLILLFMSQSVFFDSFAMSGDGGEWQVVKNKTKYIDKLSEQTSSLPVSVGAHVYVCIHTDTHVLVAQKRTQQYWFKGGRLDRNQERGYEVNLCGNRYCIYPNGRRSNDSCNESIFPGGAAEEADRTLWKAAMREFKEETGFLLNNFINQNKEAVTTEEKKMGQTVYALYVNIAKCSGEIQSSLLSSIKNNINGVDGFRKWVIGYKLSMRDSYPLPIIDTDELESVTVVAIQGLKERLERVASQRNREILIINNISAVSVEHRKTHGDKPLLELLAPINCVGESKTLAVTGDMLTNPHEKEDQKMYQDEREAYDAEASYQHMLTGETNLPSGTNDSSQAASNVCEMILKEEV